MSTDVSWAGHESVPDPGGLAARAEQGYDPVSTGVVSTGASSPM